MADIPVLSDYLASLRKRRWRPGELDCGVFMADWVRQLCGQDPIADVRGSYSTERQFLKILRREGGFETACATRLAAVGFRDIDKPVAGDLMVVLSPYAVRRGAIQRRPSGAICANAKARAVITSDMGLVIAGEADLPMIRAWSFHG